MADNILPVGIIEIAERLGVKRATVDQWGQRGLLPPADWTVGGRPAWNWPTIRQWAVDSYRAVTVAGLTALLGLPADAGERVARFAGAFTAPSEYTRTGRIPPRWAGQGMDAIFTPAEADDLDAEWHRAARRVEADATLPYLGGHDDEEVAGRYRP